jgi:hypothetical protein
MIRQFLKNRQHRLDEEAIQKGILFDLEAEEYLRYMKIKCDGFSEIDEHARWVDVIRLEIPEMQLIKDQAILRYRMQQLNTSCDTPQCLTHTLDTTEK